MLFFAFCFVLALASFCRCSGSQPSYDLYDLSHPSQQAHINISGPGNPQPPQQPVNPTFIQYVPSAQPQPQQLHQPLPNPPVQQQQPRLPNIRTHFGDYLGIAQNINIHGIVQQAPAPNPLVIAAVELTREHHDALLPDFLHGGYYLSAPLRKSLRLYYDNHTGLFTAALIDISPFRHAKTDNTNIKVLCPQVNKEKLFMLRLAMERGNRFLTSLNMPTIDLFAENHHIILNAALLTILLKRFVNRMPNVAVRWSDGSVDPEDHMALHHKTYIALRLARLFLRDKNDISNLDDTIIFALFYINHYLNELLFV